MKTRKLLSVLLLFLGGLILWLLHAHAGFKPSPPVEELKQTPRSYEPPAGPDGAGELPEPVQARAGDNLFSPERGDEKPARESGDGRRTERPSFELIGLCHIGGESGAIIEQKNRADATKKSRLYYPEGSDVGGGFILEEIGEKSVILRRKNELIELRIGRKRAAEEAKKNRASIDRRPQAVIEVQNAVPVPPPADGRNTPTAELSRN